MKVRKEISVGLALLFAITVSLEGCYFHWQRVERGFEQISIGDSQESVLKIIGRPSQKGRCGGVLGYAYRAPDCAREFVYQNPFFLSDGYAIEFDESGHVIYKDSYSYLIKDVHF